MAGRGPILSSVATEPGKLIPDANSIASEDKRLPSEIRPVAGNLIHLDDVVVSIGTRYSVI